jgi:hypothetical protein
MSLINDALKRANEVKTPPPLPSQTAKILAPVEPPSSRLPLIIFPVILGLIVFLAGFFLLRGFNRKDEAGNWRSPLQRAFAREKGSEHKAAANVDEEAAEPGHPQASVIGTKSQVRDGRPAVATNSGIAPVATVAPPSLAASSNNFPQLKVQGVFFRAKNPGALVNSKTVFVGDWIANAKVVEIRPDGITVEFQGRKKVFDLY